MYRACISNYTTKRKCSHEYSELNLHEPTRQASSIRPLNNNFAQMKTFFFAGTLFLIGLTFNGCGTSKKEAENKNGLTKTNDSLLTYVLPSPILSSNFSLEEALQKRRSRRSYQKDALSPEQLSQVLWAAYGITKPTPKRPAISGGLRTAPSAGALYPLEIYVLVGNVKGIEPGVYKYHPIGHKIVSVMGKDIRTDLCAAALNQEMVKTAPVSLLYCAVFSRTMEKYGERGRRYVYMDLGHSAENVYLQVETLHLGTCVVAAFEDEKVKEIMPFAAEEEPLYIMPIGKYYKD